MKGGRTSLMAVANSGRVDMVAKMIQLGANVQIQDSVCFACESVSGAVQQSPVESRSRGVS